MSIFATVHEGFFEPADIVAHPLMPATPVRRQLTSRLAVSLFGPIVQIVDIIYVIWRGQLMEGLPVSSLADDGLCPLLYLLLTRQVETASVDASDNGTLRFSYGKGNDVPR